MKTRLRNLWESLNTSLWFVPTLMAMGSVALAFGSVSLDGHVNAKLARSLPWLWSGGPDGARSLLSTIAGSMMTVVGVVFSITMVTLTLASSQFGSRLLRNFMRDRGNQIVLGTFISTFTYCLLVLRTIRSSSEGGFVPYLSVTIGMLLALASLGVLIFFIHHVAGAIQAENLTASVGVEFQEAVEKLCDSRTVAASDDGEPSHGKPVSFVVLSDRSGYLLSVDQENLVEAAAEADLRLRVLSLPGDFILRGAPVAEVWPGLGEETPELGEKNGKAVKEEDSSEVLTRLANAFSYGKRRTPTQDVRYSARQLVEIASRALSPGINDPFTAIGCMDWLGAGLSELARRPVPSRCHRDAQGKPRVWDEPVDFAELAGRCFEPIRSYGKDSALVVGHLLKVLGDLGRCVHREEDRSVLRRLVKRTKKDSGEELEGADTEALVPETLGRLTHEPPLVEASRKDADGSLEM